MSGPLATILHRDKLRQLADARTFERGVDYFVQGRVHHLERRDASLQATVRGGAGTGDGYAVRVWIRDNALAFSCSCPMGEEGYFCKHAVAVGLAWLQREAPAPSPSADDTPPLERRLIARSELAELRDRLGALDKQSLVELLVREAATNAQLRARLGRFA
jgi:uncharacterized Zn finger protein